MKKKLRLLVTTKCNRKCPGCCNKDWNLQGLKTIDIKNAAKYKEILITGGEPLLFVSDILKLAESIKKENPKVQIFIYTAHITNLHGIQLGLKNIDGFHVTLHEDVSPKEIELLRYLQSNSFFKKKSMRLQVFPAVDKQIPILPSFWKRITFNPWMENCPLPIDEDFKRLENVY
jgi:organic radical activating enzyme